MPMIPPQPARGGRTCASCACYYELPHPKNPLEKQGYCARQPAMVGQVRVQVPRLDKAGNPVMSRQDPKTPVSDSVEDIAFTHQPMSRSLVCMDGWRPLGTLPGQKTADVSFKAALRELAPLFMKDDATPEELRAAAERALAAYLAETLPAGNEDAATAAAQLDS